MRRNETKGPLHRILDGALAGLAGTLVLGVVRTASRSWLPGTLPPMRHKPGTYIVKQAEQVAPEATEAISPEAEHVASRMLALGYGMTAGALWALLRPRGGNSFLGGIVLGLATWAVGYLGWLPGLNLMPPIGEQDEAEAIGPPIRHVLFGIATVAAYHEINNVL